MEKNESSLPFKHQPGEEVGKGGENIVRELGPDWVIKEINPFKDDGESKSPGWLAKLRSPERIQKFLEDQRKLEEIFGKDHFHRAYYIKARSVEAKKEDRPDPKEEPGSNYYLIQKRVKGEDMASFIGSKYESTAEMVKANRGEYMELLWGAKKAFIEFGIPLDFHSGNFVIEEETGRLFVVDSGFPTEERRTASGKYGKERQEKAVRMSYRRMQSMDFYEEWLDLSEEEKSYLNEKYDIDDELYSKRIRELDEFREKVGITEEEARKDRLDFFLDDVFSDFDLVTGQDIRDAAIEYMADIETTPSSTQAGLDRLERILDMSGDRDFWEKELRKFQY